MPEGGGWGAIPVPACDSRSEGRGGERMISLWEPSRVDKGLAGCNTDRHVDGENVNRGAPRWRQTNKHRAIVPKMINPDIAPRMKQRDDVSGVRVNASQIG